MYNLHKIDTKLDWNVNSKMRLSGRFGYEPYYDFHNLLAYGMILGGAPFRQLPATRRRAGGFRVRKLRGQSHVRGRRGLG